jgi:hypothetical protein
LGEADLRALSEHFTRAETRIRGLLAKAPTGDRRALLTEARELLVALRREDARGPVAVAGFGRLSVVPRGGGERVPISPGPWP